MDNTLINLKKIKEGFVGQRMIVLPPDIQKSISANPIIKDLYLTAIGYYPKATYHDRERKHGCPEYILLYCVDGKGYIDMEGRDYALLPNSYFIIPAGLSHHYRSSASDPWSIFWVHFTGAHAKLLYSRYLENKTSDMNSIPYEEDRITMFNSIFNLLEYNFTSRILELINIKLRQFISSFVYSIEANPTYIKEDHVSNSIKYMKSHIEKTLSVNDLAAQSTYSVSHYCELFKKKTGVSPIYYFNQLKVQKSCQYLYFTDLNIKEICLKVGFEDPFYFSRLFKKLMGLSPAKYRNTYKK